MSKRAETLSVATQLLENFRAGKDDDNLDAIYADNAVSVESIGSPEMPNLFEGLDAIRAKHAWWSENFEVHSQSADGPFLHEENRFGLIFDMDVTDKNSGERSQMRELAVFTVEQKKIVREEYFYNTPADA